MSQVTESKVISCTGTHDSLQESGTDFKRNKGAVVGLVYVVM